MKTIMTLLLMLSAFAVCANKPMLAVVNKSDNSISIIDIEQQKIVKTLPTGEGPHELALALNKRYAVSTDFVGGNSLTVFDLAEREVKHTISLAAYPGPHGIEVLNDDAKVLVTSGRSQHVVSVDIENAKILKAVNVAQDTSHMLTTDNQDKFAYVSNIRSNTISIIELQSAEVIENIKTEEVPEAIKLAPNDRHLWYGANKKGLVSVIDLESKEQIAQFSDFVFPYRVLFNQTGEVAMVPDFRKHNIRFFDAKNFKEIGSIDLGEGAGPQGITLHSNKDIAYLSLNLRNTIVAIDIAKQQIIAEYPTGKNPDGVIFYYDNFE